MSFLSKINFPKDLKKLTLDELKILNDELRTFTIETVSKTGGHLGAVSYTHLTLPTILRV